MGESNREAEARSYGHGHVWPRSDGVKARCGGPKICTQCALDLAAKLEAYATPSRPSE